MPLPQPWANGEVLPSGSFLFSFNLFPIDNNFIDGFYFFVGEYMGVAPD